MSALARHRTCREARQHVDVGGTNIIHVAIQLYLVQQMQTTWPWQVVDQAKASGIFAIADLNWEELVLGFVKASELLAVQDERNRGPGMRWTAYGMLPA